MPRGNHYIPQAGWAGLETAAQCHVAPGDLPFKVGTPLRGGGLIGI